MAQQRESERQRVEYEAKEKKIWLFIAIDYLLFLQSTNGLIDLNSKFSIELIDIIIQNDCLAFKPIIL